MKLVEQFVVVWRWVWCLMGLALFTLPWWQWLVQDVPMSFDAFWTCLVYSLLLCLFGLIPGIAYYTTPSTSGVSSEEEE